MYILFFTLFYIYLVKVVGETQFPIYLSESMRANVGQNVLNNVNLIPLIQLNKDAVQTSVLNILLTIPFGFGLPFITEFKFRKVLYCGMLFSMLLETLQLLTAFISGFTFRVIDINDTYLTP